MGHTFEVHTYLATPVMESSHVGEDVTSICAARPPLRHSVSVARWGSIVERAVAHLHTEQPICVSAQGDSLPCDTRRGILTVVGTPLESALLDALLQGDVVGHDRAEHSRREVAPTQLCLARPEASQLHLVLEIGGNIGGGEELRFDLGELPLTLVLGTGAQSLEAGMHGAIV